MRHRLLAVLRHERTLPYLIVLCVVGAMIYTVWPSLNSTGILSAWDAGGHLLKADYFAHHLLSNGHLTGWFPTWHGGFELFQFYPPLLYYILGPLTLVMNHELALRLVIAGLWIGLVPATYYFLRSWHVNRTISAIGTGSLLVLNAYFGIGLGALYGVGLLPNGLGCILAIFALARLKRDFTWPDRGVRQFVLTGLSVGLLILAHTFSAYWFGLMAVTLLIVESANGGDWRLNLRRFGIIWAVALAVSAYWWVPLFLGLGQMGETGTLQQTTTGEFFRSLILAKDSGGAVHSVLAAIGLVWLFLTERYRAGIFFLTAAIVSLLLSLNIINHVLPFHSVISTSQFIRFQSFFAWLLMVLSIFGLAGMWDGLKRTKIPYVPTATFIGLLLVLYSVKILPTLHEKSGFINVVNNAPMREIEPISAYLNAHLRPGEFVLSEFNWGSLGYFGSPHYVNQHLPDRVSNYWDLDGNFPEGTIGAARPLLIASVMDQPDYFDGQQNYLLSRGVRYIISTNINTRSALATVPWAQPVMIQPHLSIYEIAGYQNRFGLPPAAAAKLKDVRYSDDGTYHLTFAEPVDLTAGTPTGLSYHRWLSFQSGNQKITAKQNAEHQLVLAGGVKQVKELDIVYRRPLITRVAGWLSIAGFLTAMALLIKPGLATRYVAPVVRRGRRRRSTAK